MLIAAALGNDVVESLHKFHPDGHPDDLSGGRVEAGTVAPTTSSFERSESKKAVSRVVVDFTGHSLGGAVAVVAAARTKR